ncbi:MAG TPA: glycosyltransferase family 4 protein [Steroidobacteraceae bacterium]
MTSLIAVLTVGTLIVAALLTGLVRRLALSHGVLDVPNFRSSHKAPTPRGGGLAIVVANTLALTILWSLHAIHQNLAWALSGSLAVAGIGLLDDRQPVPAGFRLLVHLLAAAWAVYWLGGFPSVSWGQHVLTLGWGGHMLAVLGIAWALNLFNFMDGIDGIAASEAVFVVLAAGALTASLGTDRSGVIAACLAFAAACGGFLLWNWPPAKIFMGDVGSGYLGYCLAVLALGAARENAAALWSWLILSGVFLIDATVTLARRLARGERVYEAHRSHAYQWLSRRWGSHRRVTMAVILVNVAWLLPCAVLSASRPAQAPLIVGAALVPLAIVALAAGAGRSESH